MNHIECHSQETPQQTQVETAAEPSADSPAHATDQLPDTGEPATSTPADVQTQADAQPLPEEILAAGLIPPDGGVSTASVAAEETTANADATDTLNKEQQNDVVQEVPQVQIAVPKGLAPTSTSEGNELDPSSTAALIQVFSAAGTCQDSSSAVLQFYFQLANLWYSSSVLGGPYHVVCISVDCVQYCKHYHVDCAKTFSHAIAHTSKKLVRSLHRAGSAMRLLQWCDALAFKAPPCFHVCQSVSCTLHVV